MFQRGHKQRLKSTLPLKISRQMLVADEELDQILIIGVGGMRNVEWRTEAGLAFEKGESRAWSLRRLRL